MVRSVPVDYMNPLTVTGTPSLARTLTYDTSDRLLTAAGSSGSGTMAYDIQDNLTGDGVTGASFSIDPARNLPLTFSWDSRGRLTQKGAGASATLLTFDGSNLLTKVEQPTGTWTYAYDALGYRMSSSGNGVNTASVYDANGRLLYETSTQLGFGRPHLSERLRSGDRADHGDEICLSRQPSCCEGAHDSRCDAGVLPAHRRPRHAGRADGCEQEHHWHVDLSAPTAASMPPLAMETRPGPHMRISTVTRPD